MTVINPFFENLVEWLSLIIFLQMLRDEISAQIGQLKPHRILGTSEEHIVVKLPSNFWKVPSLKIRMGGRSLLLNLLNDALNNSFRGFSSQSSMITIARAESILPFGCNPDNIYPLSKDACFAIHCSTPLRQIRKQVSGALAEPYGLASNCFVLT